MPELYFKGKEFVYNHHLTVPYRPLEPQPEKSTGEDSGNLIIHGDNLHALKALLPHYAGKVDCIFIDPPLQHRQRKLVLQRQRQLPYNEGMAFQQPGEQGGHASSRQVGLPDVSASEAAASAAFRAGELLDDSG